jgi:hypothetical protein
MCVCMYVCIMYEYVCVCVCVCVCMYVCKAWARIHPALEPLPTRSILLRRPSNQSQTAGPFMSRYWLNFSIDFHGNPSTWRFISVFTTPLRNWPLSWARCIQLITRPLHLRLASICGPRSSKLYSSLRFPHQNFVCISPLINVRYMLHPSNPNSTTKSSSSTVHNSSLCLTLYCIIHTTCFGLTYRPSSGVIYKQNTQRSYWPQLELEL